MQLESQRIDEIQNMEAEMQAEQTGEVVDEFLSSKSYTFTTFQISMIYMVVWITLDFSVLPGLAIQTVFDVARYVTHYSKRQVPDELQNVGNILKLDLFFFCMLEIATLVMLGSGITQFRWMLICLVTLNFATTMCILIQLYQYRKTLKFLSMIVQSLYSMKFMICYFAFVTVLQLWDVFFEVEINFKLKLGFYFSYAVILLNCVHAVMQLRTFQGTESEAKAKFKGKDNHKSLGAIISLQIIVNLGLGLDNFILHLIFISHTKTNYLTFCLLVLVFYDLMIVLIIWRRYKIFRQETKQQQIRDIFLEEFNTYKALPPNVKIIKFNLIQITANFFKFQPKKGAINKNLNSQTNLQTNGLDSKRYIQAKCYSGIQSVQNSGLDMVSQANSVKGEELKCSICFNNSPNTVFYPCGHGGVCQECGLSIQLKQKICPFCRQVIQDVVQIGSEPDGDVEVNVVNPENSR